MQLFRRHFFGHRCQRKIEMSPLVAQLGQMMSACGVGEWEAREAASSSWEPSSGGSGRSRGEARPRRRARSAPLTVPSRRSTHDHEIDGASGWASAFWAVLTTRLFFPCHGQRPPINSFLIVYLCGAHRMSLE